MTASPSKKASLFVVSGASGSGKTTICRKIADAHGWYYSISITTRQKRPHEQDGKDYYFVTREQFQDKIKTGEFLEWAEVYGNFYGTSRKVIEERLNTGQGVILDVDTQGAASIKKLMEQAVTVFINTPSIDDLEKRLVARKTDAADEIRRRVDYAKNEVAKMGQYDHVILNDDLERAVAEFEKIVAKYL